jgi:hypothetical protein
MPRVVCTLPNASHLINGIRFASLGDAGGMVSEEIPDHIAEGFLGIRGYELHVMPSNAQTHVARGEGKKAALAQKETD